MSNKRIFQCCVVVLWPVISLAQVSISKPVTLPETAATPTARVSSVISPSVPPDKVVLMVGTIKLTAAQFDAIIDGIPEQFRDAARSTGRKPFAENLVKVLVLAEEGKRLKVGETSAFKAQEEFQTMNHLAAVAFAEISEHGEVDDAKLRSYYEEHKAEFEQIHARHILIRTAGSVAPAKPGQKERTETEALAKAEQLRKELLAGADFAELATKESDDPGSAVRGGELDVFGHGQMVPAFDKAVFALKIGAISEPVRTPFGYHIIRVDARQPQRLDDVKPELVRQLRPQVAKEKIDDLQKKANVVFDPDFFAAPAK